MCAEYRTLYFHTHQPQLLWFLCCIKKIVQLNEMKILILVIYVMAVSIFVLVEKRKKNFNVEKRKKFNVALYFNE